MKREWNLRNIYLYLISFVTLIMIIVGSVQVIQAAVAFVYAPPIYYPGPLEIQMQTAKQGAPGGEAGAIDVKAREEQLRLERERQEQQMRYDRARRMAESLSFLVVAVPIYIYHWRKIQKEMTAD